MKSRGITFIEIAIAMLILAVALLPIFHMIHKGAEDTDISASQSFAINKATELLNTCLDNVPFEALRAGSPFGWLRVDDIAGIKEYQDDKIDAAWCDRMAEMLFKHPTSARQSSGYPCQGRVTDPRGITYQVTLRVEDISDKTPAGRKPDKGTFGSAFSPSQFSPAEIVFTFLRNPAKVDDPAWIACYRPDPAGTTNYETGLSGGIAVPPSSLYVESDFAKNTIRFTQRQSTEKVNYTGDEAFAYCTMKRLICEVQWNINKNLYSKPEADDPLVQRIHLMTLKADVSR